MCIAKLGYTYTILLYKNRPELNLISKALWITQCIAEKDLGTCLIVLLLYASASLSPVCKTMHVKCGGFVATTHFHSLIDIP